MKEFIVSLTSYPKRISTVHIAIRSILEQSVKADKVILWLTEEEFPRRETDLPVELLELQKEGLIISWCENLKSYNKLIPCLQAYPDAVVITADDDIVYDKNWLRILIESYISNPYCIHCHRPDKITMEDGVILPYIQWLNHGTLNNTKPSYLLMLAGVAGVLYPAHCLSNNIFNYKEMLELCPNNDDVWFWGNALLNGTKIHMVKGAIKYPKYIDGTQEVGMWNTHNKFDDVTGKCIRDFLEAYPLAKRIFMSEYISDKERLVLEEENKLLKHQLSQVQDANSHLKASLSFKVGRAITWLPRMTRDLIRK